MSACDNLHTNSDSHSCKTLPISDVAFERRTEGGRLILCCVSFAVHRISRQMSGIITNQ